MASVIKKYPGFFNFFVGSLACTLSCVSTPLQPTEQAPSYKYQVSIPSMNIDTLSISLSINTTASASETLRLILPPVYADNPLLKLKENNIHQLKLCDTSGTAIPYSIDTIVFGPYRHAAISFAARLTPAVFSYKVTFPYDLNDLHTAVPIPKIGEKVGLLIGNYLFAAPFAGSSILDLWRRSVTIAVSYTVGETVCLWGDPKETNLFRNAYELLFSMSGVVAASDSTAHLLADSQVCDQRFRIVSLGQNQNLPPQLIAEKKRQFGTICRDIISLFGTYSNHPVTILTGINDRIGFEGMHAFCLRNPFESDTQGVVAMTMAHEFLHGWIGLKTGEYDDPWWKEGTTNYGGFLIAKRNNLCSSSFVEATLLADLSKNPDIDAYALSDRSVRFEIFTNRNLGSIVYTKGAQVTMLLDRYIREVSGSSSSIMSVLAALSRNCPSAAFSRSLYVQELVRCSDSKITQIFANYIDKAGVIPEAVLQENLQYLRSVGAFGN